MLGVFRAAVALVAISSIFLSIPVAAQNGNTLDRELTQPLGEAQAMAFELAMKLFKARDYAGAIPQFGKAIALQPRFAVALAERGFAYIEVGDYANAQADHDAVLALDPSSANAWANSCWVRAVASIELNRALELCTRSLTMDRRMATLDIRGFVHFRRGEFTDAIADYDAAIRERRNASSLFMRGVCRSHLGQKTEGARDIDVAVKLDADVKARYARYGVSPPP